MQQSSVEVVQHDHGLNLTQSSFIADILNKFNMLDTSSVSTSLSTSEILSLDDVNKLAQFQHSPSTKHCQATKRLLRYLKGTVTYGVHFKHGNSSQLHAYSDADWGGIPDTRHSTSAYVIFLGKNPISWCSTSNALLPDLQQKQNTGLSQVFCDNIGVTYLCRNPVFHSRMKHVAIDFYFVHDQVESGKISVHHIPTGAQLANALTKALPRRSFDNLVSNIGLKQIESMLRGHVKDKNVES
ncbi:hypothetical protein KY290_010420 [Solanum tuberosum]|uniref:Uncharacterized protein n=1 Tax=Solanum tuberosum TaxID=4113 RepID=A0ABQ7VXQ8_SOLTU|nr:hypothetical protein KY290_010420 [Solanum tuberosum]